MNFDIHLWQYIVISVLITISAIAKSLMDTVSFHYGISIFPKLTKSESFYNPLFSWSRKWKNGDPKQGEAFLGSSTVFVSLTDFWHLMGLIRDFTLVSIIPIVSGNYWLFFLYIPYRLVFHIFYTYVFVKKS